MEPEACFLSPRVRASTEGSSKRQLGEQVSSGGLGFGPLPGWRLPGSVRTGEALSFALVQER